jgi:Zn-dependent M16 (insulinase) family peptidase
MNAWTGPDFTAYPFSTKNEQDFENLLRVYCDAVFRPLLDRKDFMQEGWRWEVDTTNDELKANGVVFNEMKGVFESQNAFVSEKVLEYLFEGSQYSNCSGGDPIKILDLNYTDFKDFHKQYYHPSNCTLVTYGDISPNKYMPIIEQEYLKFFEKNEMNVIPEHPVKLKNKQVHISGPPNSDTVKPGYDAQFSLNFLLRDLSYESKNAANTLDLTGLQILKILLFDFPKSPFYKEFLEDGQTGGYSYVNGLNDNMYFPYFTIGKSVPISIKWKASEIFRTHLRTLWR